MSRGAWAPALVPVFQMAAPAPAPIVAAPSVVEVVRAAKESPKPAGWRFVPVRDADNLIVEIIATPIIESDI